MNNHEKLKYLKLFIMLAAGLAMMICDFMTQRDLTTSLIHLSVVLVVFAAIGEIVVEIIQKVIAVPDEEALDAVEPQAEMDGEDGEGSGQDTAEQSTQME